MTSIFFPSISPEEGEPNNEVIPSKVFKYQLESQILSGIKNEREIYYSHVGNYSLYVFAIFEMNGIKKE